MRVVITRREGAVVQSDAVYRLRRSDDAGSNEEAANRAEFAAAQEAQRNAARGDTAGYRMQVAGASLQSTEDAAVGSQATPVSARVVIASSAILPKVSSCSIHTAAIQEACIYRYDRRCNESFPRPQSLHSFHLPIMGLVLQEAVRDTTGAGDACVGTLLYGICTGMPLPATMKLAAVVAAAKCVGLGARATLPHQTDVRQDLLQ